MVLDQPAAKQSFFIGQLYPSWDLTGKRYIYNFLTKERVCDKPDLSTLSKTIKVMKIHASTNGVSSIAIHKHGWGLDQMNRQQVVKLLRDIFVYADVWKIVYNLEDTRIHEMSA